MGLTAGYNIPENVSINPLKPIELTAAHHWQRGVCAMDRDPRGVMCPPRPRTRETNPQARPFPSCIHLPGGTQ